MGLRLDSSDLALSFRTLLELCHLLSLNRWRSNLLTENDVSDFTGSQRSNIDAVALAEILYKREIRRHDMESVKATYSENEILQGDLDLDPFLI